MAQQPLSKRFARAFLDVLQETVSSVKELDVYANELKALSVLTKDQMGDFFQSPLFETKEKQTVLDEVFQKNNIQKKTQAFVSTLNQLGKMNLLEEIANDFLSELLSQEGIVKVNIQSAHPLEGKDETKIKELFANRLGKKILLETHLNKELIGGICANIEGVVYDASIAGYLNRLEKQFS